MKKWLIISGVVTIIALMAGCSKVRRSPGRVYMPDMNYSRAYETYATSTEKLLKEKGIHYSGMPVPGTIARGDLFPYTLKNDSTDYARSVAVKSPLDAASIEMTEAERLYLVNCAICHGVKLDGQGPLVKSNKFPVAAADFITNDKYIKMPEGQMFHSITYGINMMGSYAAQLSSHQRWMVIAYIKSKQSTKTTTITADSTVATK